MSNLETLPARMKRLTTDRGLSQAKFGKLAGVDRNKVGRWLRGEQVPSSDELVWIAQVLDLSLEELLDGIDIQDKTARRIVGPLSELLTRLHEADHKLHLAAAEVAAHERLNEKLRERCTESRLEAAEWRRRYEAERQQRVGLEREFAELQTVFDQVELQNYALRERAANQAARIKSLAAKLAQAHADARLAGLTGAAVGGILTALLNSD